jgi:uncharacterized Fe-S cluster-containing MiaB family protein
MNLHLNPTYVAAGTPLATAFEQRQYSPPRLRDVARAAKAARDGALSIFIGLNEEGLAVHGGSFIRDGEEHVVGELERFNRTQDFGILDLISQSESL